ncbi:MAG: hypothetical protein K2M12_00670, partial [Muribaculaceae bacterium]|nr:hypothetical protein [Muribaculaceae bacterium]
MKLSLRLKSAATILAAICMANTTATGAEQRYAASSRLAQGTWMKGHVNTEGIHEISYDQLRAWGFADPAKVNVYGYGATALALDRLSEGADDLPPTPTVHTADGRRRCYAAGALRLDLRHAAGHDDL